MESGNLRLDHEQLTLAGLRPLAVGIFAIAAVALALDAVSVPAAAAHDLLLLACAGIVVLVARPERLHRAAPAPLCIALALLMLWNLLLPRPGISDAARALHFAILLIAVAACVLSRAWMLAGLVLLLAVFGAWATRHGVSWWVPAAAVVVALPLHLMRARALMRARQRRQKEAGREQELQRTLAATEELRRTLDEKVAERTAELAETAAELRHELAERRRAAAERAALEARLQHEAMHDALTGLPNRALFLDRLGHAWRRTFREPGFRFAVLYLDLDRFKVINDTFGHEIGDRLLIGIAARLPSCLRPTDTVARLGGDEFAVLLEGFATVAETVAIAERIRTILNTPFRIDVHEIYASASIGIADGVVEGQPPEQYVRDADVAMYAAKSRGTPYERFDGGMHSPALARMLMETELRAAIEKQQFFLVYQPVVDLRTMRLEGFEALVRWRHPSRGVVGPDEFIGLAEETRLILPLTLWVLRTACRQAAIWREKCAGPAPLLGVNLSAQLVTRTGMATEMLEVLQEANVPPSALAIEVTESALMASPQVAAEILGALRERGAQVFVDDFGTGYSSLAYLTTLPVDRLKIDRSFIAAIDDQNRLRIVRTIATLAHDLGKALVAEGVETPDQLDRLRAMGCEFGQGWLFARPMDERQALALVEANETSVAFPGLVEMPDTMIEEQRLALVE
ncbi:MAG TPA: EAL domain-containing protein [Myxococcales bacterium]